MFCPSATALYTRHWQRILRYIPVLYHLISLSIARFPHLAPSLYMFRLETIDFQQVTSEAADIVVLDSATCAIATAYFSSLLQSHIATYIPLLPIPRQDLP